MAHLDGPWRSRETVRLSVAVHLVIIRVCMSPSVVLVRSWFREDVQE